MISQTVMYYTTGQSSTIDRQHAPKFQIPNQSQINPKSIPNQSQINPKSIPNQSQINPKSNHHSPIVIKRMKNRNELRIEEKGREGKRRKEKEREGKVDLRLWRKWNEIKGWNQRVVRSNVINTCIKRKETYTCFFTCIKRFKHVQRQFNVNVSIN